LKISAHELQSRKQTVNAQSIRFKSGGKRTYGLNRTVNEFAYQRYFSKRNECLSRRKLLERGYLKLQHDQILAKLIVQFPRYPSSFVLANRSGVHKVVPGRFT
jgi:hypothetical protein